MWSCEQCATDPDLHIQRGRCHGLLDAALEGADLDERGQVVVPGDLVVVGAKAPFGTSQWSRCPIAQARQPETRELLSMHRAIRDGRLFDSPDLTIDAIDALDHAEIEETALRHWQTKRAQIEAGP